MDINWKSQFETIWEKVFVEEVLEARSYRQQNSHSTFNNESKSWRSDVPHHPAWMAASHGCVLVYTHSTHPCWYARETGLHTQHTLPDAQMSPTLQWEAYQFQFSVSASISFRQFVIQNFLYQSSKISGTPIFLYSTHVLENFHSSCVHLTK